MPIQKNIMKRIEEKKALLDSLRPFPKSLIPKIREYFDVELTYNSNSIEGNTLNLQETRAVMEDGVTIGGKTLREHLEVTNHKKAIDFIFSILSKKRVEEKDILDLHAIILDRIDPQNAGFYRHSQVYLRGSRYIPPPAREVPVLMKDFVKSLGDGGDTVEAAAMAHFRLVHIHPFIDGNGRAARLLMNLMLLKKGYPITVILRAERKKYINCLELAHKGDTGPFLDFVAKSVERSLDIYLSMLDPSFSDKYISLGEASKRCGHSQEYLSLLARKGRLGAIKFGRNWVITKKALEDYTKSVKKG
jgi:excisionase family DNA binding protein